MRAGRVRHSRYWDLRLRRSCEVDQVGSSLPKMLSWDFSKGVFMHFAVNDLVGLLVAAIIVALAAACRGRNRADPRFHLRHDPAASPF
jgi:hypothetical protein